MPWQLTLIKSKDDDAFHSFDEIKDDTLLGLMNQFSLVLAKIYQKRIEFLESEVASLKLVLKNNNIDEDDIPF